MDECIFLFYVEVITYPCIISMLIWLICVSKICLSYTTVYSQVVKIALNKIDICNIDIISNEWDISFHALAWQLPSPIMHCAINCDVIAGRKRMIHGARTESMCKGRHLLAHFISCKNYYDVRTVVYAFTGVLFWYLIPLLFRNWGNNSQYMAAYKTCNFIGMSLPDHHIIWRRQWQIKTRHVTLSQPRAGQ